MHHVEPTWKCLPAVALGLSLVLFMVGCGAAPTEPSQGAEVAEQTAGGQANEPLDEQADGPPEGAQLQEQEQSTMNIEVNGSVLRVVLADNPSAGALRERLSQGSLTLHLTDYAGFEKVGPLGLSLPANDEPLTTVPGDVVLYQGDQLCVYYGENSWDFTRLGRVEGVSAEELRSILGTGDVDVTLSLGSASRAFAGMRLSVRVVVGTIG